MTAAMSSSLKSPALRASSTSSRRASASSGVWPFLGRGPGVPGAGVVAHGRVRAGGLDLLRLVEAQVQKARRRIVDDHVHDLERVGVGMGVRHGQPGQRDLLLGLVLDLVLLLALGLGQLPFRQLGQQGAGSRRRSFLDELRASSRGRSRRPALWPCCSARTSARRTRTSWQATGSSDARCCRASAAGRRGGSCRGGSRPHRR